MEHILRKISKFFNDLHVTWEKETVMEAFEQLSLENEFTAGLKGFIVKSSLLLIAMATWLKFIIRDKMPLRDFFSWLLFFLV